MSDLIEGLAAEVRRRPLLTLAVTGALGAVLVSRLRADDDRVAAIADGGRRGVDALGDRVADLADKGVSLFERERARSADAAARVAREASGAGRDALESGRDAGREAGDALRAGAATASDRASDALDGFSLEDTIRRLVDERFGPSRAERVRRAAASVGITEKTVSVFAATLLAKSASGYVRWRGEQKARHQGAALSEAAGRDLPARLEDHTVVELRQMAAEREIEGRSSMNKDELVEALGEGR